MTTGYYINTRAETSNLFKVCMQFCDRDLAGKSLFSITQLDICKKYRNINTELFSLSTAFLIQSYKYFVNTICYTTMLSAVCCCQFCHHKPYKHGYRGDIHVKLQI